MRIVHQVTLYALALLVLFAGATAVIVGLAALEKSNMENERGAVDVGLGLLWSGVALVGLGALILIVGLVTWLREPASAVDALAPPSNVAAPSAPTGPGPGFRVSKERPEA